MKQGWVDNRSRRDQRTWRQTRHNRCREGSSAAPGRGACHKSWRTRTARSYGSSSDKTRAVTWRHERDLQASLRHRPRDIDRASQGDRRLRDRCGMRGQDTTRLPGGSAILDPHRPSPLPARSSRGGRIRQPHEQTLGGATHPSPRVAQPAIPVQKYQTIIRSSGLPKRIRTLYD